MKVRSILPVSIPLKDNDGWRDKEIVAQRWRDVLCENCWLQYHSTRSASAETCDVLAPGLEPLVMLLVPGSGGRLKSAD
jgi:hypothetical protein